MSGLSFLKNITAEAPAKQPRTVGPRKERNPELQLALRIFKDGSIYPSQGLVDRFNLEYPKQAPASVEGGEPAHVAPGNGLDIFSINDFSFLKGVENVLVVNVVAKDEPKVDVFGRTDYDEKTGEPLSSVMDQGATSFGKNELLGMIDKFYELNPDEKVGLDLVFLGIDGEEANVPYKLRDDLKVCYVPKTLSRGGKKGEPTFQKRDNPKLFILYPKVLIDEAEGIKAKEASAVRKAADAAKPTPAKREKKAKEEATETK